MFRRIIISLALISVIVNTSSSNEFLRNLQSWSPANGCECGGQSSSYPCGGTLDVDYVCLSPSQIIGSDPYPLPCLYCEPNLECDEMELYYDPNRDYTDYLNLC